MNSKEYEDVIARLNEQNAMLGATMLALCAAASMLRKDQFQELMQRIARDSAEKQAFVEQQPSPQAAALVRQMQAAEHVVFQTLQETWSAHNKG